MKKDKTSSSEQADEQKRSKDPAARASALGLSSMQTGYGNAGVVNASLALRVEENSVDESEEEQADETSDQ